MPTETEAPEIPNLNLANLDLATLEELPQLEVIVRNSKSDVIGNVATPLTALIVSPQNRVLNLEAACSSDSGAHAIMGAVSDPRGSVEFKFFCRGNGDDVEILPPESPRVANVRLAVTGWSRHVHHVAMLDRSGDLILAADDRLLTNAIGFRSNPHIDRYIQRQMRGVFDCLIADEVHELAAAESIQGNTFGTLAGACKYTIALTGTLIGGKASDLHAPLWRMSAELLNVRGFDIQAFKGSRISAIARNERPFVHRYGVMEHQIIRSVADDFSSTVNRGACGRRKSYKTNERIRPGINPDLFNHFLLDRAVFMGLHELGPALPSLKRVLISCEMSGPLRAAYTKLDDDLRAAIKKRVNGKGPPGLAATRVQVLDAYLDKPWDWKPILAPKYNELGQRCGMETVAVPADLGQDRADDKDEKLVEIVKAELNQNRKCAVYPQFTGVHDVRGKLLKLLTDAGIRAVILPDTVKPEARESWIEKHVSEIDVLIAHPKRVMTGLDLIQLGMKC